MIANIASFTALIIMNTIVSVLAMFFNECHLYRVLIIMQASHLSYFLITSYFLKEERKDSNKTEI